MSIKTSLIWVGSSSLSLQQLHNLDSKLPFVDHIDFDINSIENCDCPVPFTDDEIKKYIKFTKRESERSLAGHNEDDFKILV